MKQIWRTEKPEEVSSKQAVLVDIDGVLSDASHRQHYLRGVSKKSRDWQGFFSACVEDPPIEDMVEMMNWLNPEMIIVALTARPHWVQNQTQKWLNTHNVRWDILVMREEAEDPLSAKDFKSLATKELTAAGFNFVLGFEDDPDNIEAIKAVGVPCVYVHSGYYEGKTV